MGIEHTQNFLHSEKLVANLLSMSNLSLEDTVIEIGPGKGIITKMLAEKCKSVVAVEYDKDLANSLIGDLGDIGNVQIVESDFLQYSLPKDYDYKMCANIPFNITADIMKKVLESDYPPEDIYFIMQYEAFQKYSGNPYCSESMRSLFYKPFYKSELLYEFKPTDFSPIPNARICFAHFARRTEYDVEDIAEYRDFISYIFLASGKSFREKTKKIFTREQHRRISKELAFDLDSTITSMSYDEWLFLYNIFINYVPKEKKLLVSSSEKKMKKTQEHIEKIHRTRCKGSWETR